MAPSFRETSPTYPAVAYPPRHANLASSCRYINEPTPPIFSFLLHTYLVGATVIKKTVCYNSSPTLHIVEARVIECPSGPSLAEFLMVFLISEVFLSLMVCLAHSFGEGCRLNIARVLSIVRSTASTLLMTIDQSRVDESMHKVNNAV